MEVFGGRSGRGGGGGAGALHRSPLTHTCIPPHRQAGRQPPDRAPTPPTPPTHSPRNLRAPGDRRSPTSTVAWQVRHSPTTTHTTPPLYFFLQPSLQNLNFGKCGPWHPQSSGNHGPGKEEAWLCRGGGNLKQESAQQEEASAKCNYVHMETVLQSRILRSSSQTVAFTSRS